MKKFLFGAAVLFLMANCSGNGTTEKAKNDSTCIADSIVKVEAAKSVAEQAKYGVQNEKKDTLQNSEDDLKQINEENESREILAALPDPKRLLNGGDPTKYLKSLGFKGSNKRVPTMEGDRYVGKYSFEAGNKSITVSWENLLGSDEWDVTIKNDNKALENYYSKAKKQAGRGEYWEIVVKKKGNTVKMYSNSD